MTSKVRIGAESNSSTEGGLQSMRFMDMETLVNLRGIFRAWRFLLSAVRCLLRRNKALAERILRVVQSQRLSFERALWTANARLSLEADRPELITEYARRLGRPRKARADEWVNSVAEVLRKDKWLRAEFTKITSDVRSGAKKEYVKTYLYGGAVPKRDALYFRPGNSDKQGGLRSVLPLEEITEQTSEAVLAPVYTERSVAELRAAVADDLDLRAYLDVTEAHPDWTRAQRWASLGWSENKGKAVDRKFRRKRCAIQPTAGVVQIGDGRHVPLNAGSVTSYFEPLFDGSRGCRVGVWQHLLLKDRL